MPRGSTESKRSVPLLVSKASLCSSTVRTLTGVLCPLVALYPLVANEALSRPCAGAENEEPLVDLESLQFESAVEGDALPWQIPHVCCTMPQVVYPYTAVSQIEYFRLEWGR